MGGQGFRDNLGRHVQCPSHSGNVLRAEGFFRNRSGQYPTPIFGFGSERMNQKGQSVASFDTMEAVFVGD